MPSVYDDVRVEPGDNIVTQQEDLEDKNKEERGVPTQFFFPYMHALHLFMPPLSLFSITFPSWYPLLSSIMHMA